VRLRRSFRSMKVKFTTSFQQRLLHQVDYIASDSPQRARKFYEDLMKSIDSISHRPYSFRMSRFFDDKNVRDLVFNGYVVVFRVNADFIEVFGFVKGQNKVED